MKTIEDKEVENRTTVLPHGRKLPFWEPPRTKPQAIARLKNGMREWARHTEDNIYKWGKTLNWLKHPDRCKHGEWLQRLADLELKPRTAQDWMKHANNCDEANRIMTPHWIRKKGKYATVALLDPPEIQDKSELNITNPRHDSEPLNWSAAEAAQRLLEIFEKLTGHRKIEEMEDVAHQFEELVRDYIDSRREDRLIRRGVLPDAGHVDEIE